MLILFIKFGKNYKNFCLKNIETKFLIIILEVAPYKSFNFKKILKNSSSVVFIHENLSEDQIYYTAKTFENSLFFNKKIK